MTRLFFKITLLTGAAAVIGVAGCSSEPDYSDEVAAMNESNIQRLGNIYAAHQTFRGGQGPKDEAAFKKFIEDFDPAKLEMMGINPGAMGELFKSERDGKPFKIRYSVGGGRGAEVPVIFEAEGQNGMKQVGFTGGKVEEVNQSTYDRMFAGKTGGTSPGAGPGGGRPGGGAPSGAPTPPGK